MITIHQRNQKFPTMMTLSAKSAQNFTSLSSAWQIYQWPAHNSINFEFTCSILLIRPIHKYAIVQKMQCSASTGDKQFTNEQISQYQIPLMSKFPVLSISLFSAESGQASYRKVPCFTNKVLEWYKHVFQFSLNLCIHLMTRSELQFS